MIWLHVKKDPMHVWKESLVALTLTDFDLSWVYFVSQEIKIGKATMKLPFFVWNQRNKPEVSAQPSVSFKVLEELL